MTTNFLLTPILNGGIRNTHFFNGRLLTAEALRDEQSAQRRQHQALGQAVGSGVISGLWVGPSRQIEIGTENVVHVDGGLALNRLGQSMTLGEGGLNVTLKASVEVNVSHTGPFANCDAPITAAPDEPLNAFILTISPAFGFEDKAPMHGLNDKGALNGCGSRYATEGVQFRLAGLDATKLPGISQSTREQLNELLDNDNDKPERLAKLRNMLAHLCLGREEAAGFAADPFAQADGVQDALGLKACEVPLALLHITNRGIRFIDNWAVRRRVTPAALSNIWPIPTGQRRLAEAEATFLQFQAQLDRLIQDKPSDATKIKATDYFRYLPSAGLLRLNEGNSPGIKEDAFFDGIATPNDPFPLEGSQLVPLMQAAWHYPPIDLDKGEGIWVYQVRENAESTTAQPYLFFTTSQMQPLGNGRFDANRWDYFNFS